MPSSLFERIESVRRGKSLCRRFQDVEWKERWSLLDELGCVELADGELREISRSEARSFLAHAMSQDLCYRSKIASAVAAQRTANEFLDEFDKDARFYSNGNRPYDGKSA